jgi:hypothetical protein
VFLEEYKRIPATEEATMKYEDTKFKPIFSEFGGVKRIITSIDFRLSLLLGIFFGIIAWYFCIIKEVVNAICPIFITVSATMIAVAIAGLAIIVSMSAPEFIRILKQVGIYNNILFMFWYSTVISGSSIIINTLTYIIPYLTNEYSIFLILLSASTFLVLYSIFSVILLVGTTMRYGLYRGAFIEQEGRKDSD